MMCADSRVLDRQRSVRSHLLGVLFVAAIPANAVAEVRQVPAPILVVIDLHADPMFGTPQAQAQLYQEWVDATNWVLDVSEPRGAKISFLSTGEFMEWVLEDPTDGYPLIQRLYASGGQIGTHSHNKIRDGTHDWRPLGPGAPVELILQHWNDHVGAVNDVIMAALDVSDPDEIMAINCMRGTHTPAGDAIWQIQLMADYGFTIHQTGPEERFYGYFKHHAMNPFRPSGAHFLEHDPEGPVVVVPFGPMLGHNVSHQETVQDMRMPAVQSRFLLELLNWLHDVHVAQTDRVWVTGWSAHCHNVIPERPSRLEWEPMLNWMMEHFVGQAVGGHIAAKFAGAPAARDAYLAWEADHSDEASFSYPASETDWDLYPYLIPAVTYLTEAMYESAMPPVGTVRWHRLTTSESVGGPYPLYVAYTTDEVAATVKLAAYLGAGSIAAVDPITGHVDVSSTCAVEVPFTGTILVPVDKIVPIENASRTYMPTSIHDVDLLDNGNLLVTDGGFRGEPGTGGVYEIDRNGNVIWSYTTGLTWAHNADKQADETVIISDTGNDRVIIVDQTDAIV